MENIVLVCTYTDWMISTSRLLWQKTTKMYYLDVCMNEKLTKKKTSYHVSRLSVILYHKNGAPWWYVKGQINWKFEYICSYPEGILGGDARTIPLFIISRISYLAVVWRASVDPKWPASDTISSCISRGQLGWKSTNTKMKTVDLRKDVCLVGVYIVKRNIYAGSFVHTWFVL